MVNVDERSICVTRASVHACYSALVDVSCQNDERKVERHIDIVMYNVTGRVRERQSE